MEKNSRDRLLCRLLAFFSVFLLSWNSYVAATVIIAQKAWTDASILFVDPYPGFSNFTTFQKFSWSFFVGNFILVLYCHLNVWNSDPGYLENLLPACSDIPEDPDRCTRCNVVWKPPRAHHCRICNKCVFRMDHHCPWINNCVGLLNFKFFFLFLVFSVILCAEVALMSLGQILYWCVSPIYGKTAVSPITAIVMVITLFLSGGFSYFFKVFLSDQLLSLRLNSTLIENNNWLTGRQLLTGEAMVELFGDNLLSYGIPTKPKLKVDLHDPVINTRSFFDDPDGVELFIKENERTANQVNLRKNPPHDVRETKSENKVL
eukprot:GHVP01059261.1.p1 GENE.GHVP01059261.1~~GHVP01059261.1.p1  ORF type:complete len:318 (+),score=34.80 GHVP01059261.1:28-981(+)